MGGGNQEILVQCESPKASIAVLFTWNSGRLRHELFLMRSDPVIPPEIPSEPRVASHDVDPTPCTSNGESGSAG